MGLTNAISGVVLRPRRIMLYGTHGIGKSTWASKAPRPFFLTCEDGLNDIGCDRTPLLKSFGEFNSWLSQLGTEDHDHKAVVIDTADWLEKLIWAQTCADGGKHAIEEFGYGKGYKNALTKWGFVLSSLEHLRATRNMAIIILAHAKEQKIEPPDRDPHTRYAPDLHDLASSLIQEWADEVLFAHYVVHVKEKEGDFGRKTSRAIGGKTRKINTSEEAAFLAKRRLELPDELPMEWQAYADAVKAARPKKGDIQGIVTDGSSKTKPTAEVTSNV